MSTTPNDFLDAFGTPSKPQEEKSGLSILTDFLLDPKEIERSMAERKSLESTSEVLPEVPEPKDTGIPPTLPIDEGLVSSYPESAESHEQKILRLQRELNELRLEKLLAEEKLEKELRLQRETAANSTLTVKQDWVALANELAMLKGDVIGEKTPLENGVIDRERSEGLCIDFVNKLRIGVLKDLANDTDDVVIVKAKAYEIYYRATLHTLESRALRIKIKRTEEFEKTKKELKKLASDVKVAKEEKKEASRRRTPEEQLVDSFMALGMSREMATAQVAVMQAKAKEVK